jgi:hypothetical protein
MSMLKNLENIDPSLAIGIGMSVIFIVLLTAFTTDVTIKLVELRGRLFLAVVGWLGSRSRWRASP